jgi:hypothetical protein
MIFYLNLGLDFRLLDGTPVGRTGGSRVVVDDDDGGPTSAAVESACA